MKAHRLLSDDILVEKAVSVLMKQLGPVETSRFLAMPRGRRLESVKRHRQWQSKLDKNAFFDKVFR